MSVPCFDINKYLGTWYELVHYPSWFQRNDNYNTTAHYHMHCDGTVKVHNSTISHGKVFDSYGIAKVLAPYALRVDFPMPEVQKLQMSSEFGAPSNFLPSNEPNYIIDKIWANEKGEYMFAVVTDLYKQSLYLLSRYPDPPLCWYNVLMDYIVNNYDRDRLVQTPHYH